MQIRLSSDPGKGKKSAKLRVKTSTPTPAEIEAANKVARDISLRRGLLQGENLNVGNQIPKYYDALTGKELGPNDAQPPVGMLSNKVPSYVKSLEWDSKANLPYYIDEKTGDAQYVNKDLFHAPRFNPMRNNPSLSLLNTVAKK